MRCFAVLCFALVFLSACGHYNVSNKQSTKNQDKPGDLSAAPYHLRIGEGFTNPIGYYEQQPRFSWKMNSANKALFQSAYQIQVASEANHQFVANLWDSQKQMSTQNAWIKYQGQTLQSRQKAYWRVRMWDEHGQVSAWSDPASFELGLLGNNDWQATWIRHPETGETYQREFRNRVIENKLYRPQYLRKGFDVSQKIKQARLYISAKGIFKAHINGQQVGKDVMTPGWTPYLQRIETLTYDVTELLAQGENVIGAIVAEGWHTGRILSPQVRDVKPSALLAQLEITLEDGTVQTIASNESWKVSIEGPIRSAGIYDGETYDENFALPDWDTTRFDDSTWKVAIAEPLEPEVELAPKRHTAATTKLVIPAVEIVQVANPQEGVVVFDMGQNMVGVPELNIPVLANQRVTMRFAEALEHNTFYTENMRSALATNYYTATRTGMINYVPTFTFHGYRYIEISGFDSTKTPELNWVNGLVQHSDFDVHASFESSHPKLNKLAENVVWGLRGNFLDIPTDCPQRDERLGWTGDAQVFAQPSMYMADVYGFWSAWLQSVREEQDVDGRVPNFIPTKQNRHTKGASSGWGDAAIIIPWELYEVTGDTQILAENYEMMQGWIAFHESKSSDYISSMISFRDWLQPFPSITEGPDSRRGDTPEKLVSTAYFARSLDYIARAATVLGKHDDARKYKQLFARVKKAFRDTLYDEQTKVKSNSTQTSYLIPLAFDLFEGEDVMRAQQHLLGEFKRADNHLRTGFLGTPLLAPVLQAMGRSDLMYDILFKESYPSWFYSINNGATTTWERWDSYSLQTGFSDQSMNSLNHYAYGAVSQWFYEGILGIRPLEPGFTHVSIAPQFTSRLSNARGAYKTPQGEVEVSWTVSRGQLDMTVVIPKNTRADFVFHGLQANTLVINGTSAANLNLVNQKPGVYRITGNIDWAQIAL